MLHRGFKPFSQEDGPCLVELRFSSTSICSRYKIMFRLLLPFVHVLRRKFGLGLL